VKLGNGDREYLSVIAWYVAPVLVAALTIFVGPTLYRGYTWLVLGVQIAPPQSELRAVDVAALVVATATVFFKALISFAMWADRKARTEGGDGG